MNEFFGDIICVVIYAVLILGVVRAARVSRHPVLIGIAFAVIAIASDVSCIVRFDSLWIPSYREMPVIAAGFYASSLTTVIAGVLSAAAVAIEYFFVLSPAPEYAQWLNLIGGLEIFTTLLVTAYALLVRRFILDKEKPNFIQAEVLGEIGEAIHIGTTFLILGVFTRWAADHLNTAGTEASNAVTALQLNSLNLEFFYSFYPETLALSGGAWIFIGLLAIDWKKQKKLLFTPFTLGMLGFAAIIVFIGFYTDYLGFQETRKTLTKARSKLIIQIEDQIGYMLHRNAVTLSNQLGTPKKYSIGEMQHFADRFDVDEINIFSQERKLLASNLASVLANNQNSVPKNELQDFFELCSGQRDFVKNPFRANRSDDTSFEKYIGVPFEDRSAFLQMGYSWKHLLDEFPTFFFPMFDTTAIGNNGYFIVTDLEGKIVAPVPGRPDQIGKTIFDAGLTQEQWDDIPKDKMFETNLFGIWSQCTWQDGLERYRVYAVLPNTEYFTPNMRMAVMIIFLLFIAACAFRILILRNAHTRAKLDAMRQGDMELAASIQDSELQKTPLDDPVYCVTATMTPAREVGGDFFDYYRLADSRVAVTIADVSGKGVPAAFVMMKARSVLKSCLFNYTGLQEAVLQANARLTYGNQACMFITAWVGIFDPATGKLEYISAGHNPPLVKRADGTIQWLNGSKRYKPLAIFPNPGYEVQAETLTPGDTLYLYTDGVTEAMNSRSELFGEKRLENVIQHADGNLIDAVSENLDMFTGKAPQADDITMLTLEVKKDEQDC